MITSRQAIGPAGTVSAAEAALADNRDFLSLVGIACSVKRGRF
jgi:hypothetical protein